MFAIGSLSDPFDAFNYPTASHNPIGRTVRSSRLNPSESTAILVALGQSLIASSENANYTPTNGAKVDNLSVFDGGIYAAQDPLLGAGVYNAGGCWLSRLADKLITSGAYDRVILVPIGRGSSTVQDWGPSGFMFKSLLAAHRRLAALGLVATCNMWMQGQANAGISQGDYQAALASVISGIRAHGFTSAWLLGKDTNVSGATDPNIRSAIDALVNGSDILAGADTDGLSGANRYDGVHFSASGANAAAELWRASIAAGL